MDKMNIFEHGSVKVVDSREVAEMVDKQHKHLLRDIAGYIDAMEKSIEPKIGPNDFFILSEYKDSIGRTLPCYLCTKKGCELIAHKITGPKGIVFTAAYIYAFEEMEQQIKGNYRNASLGELANIIREFRLLMNKGYSLEETTTVIKLVCNQAGLYLPEFFVKKTWDSQQLTLPSLQIALTVGE